MTLAPGIKRLVMPVAGVIAAAVIVLLAVSLLIDRASVRQDVEKQLRAATGLDLVVNGGIQISIFPGHYVTLHNVELKVANAGGEQPLAVDTITAHLRLLPLLVHRFEIADVVLTNPRINVTRNAQGRSNWTPIVETLARTIKPGPDNEVSFSEIRVIDGTLTYRNEAGDPEQILSDIDLSLGWPSISRSFAATGQFDWRGQRIDGSLAVNDFVAALSGEKSGLKVRAVAAPLKFAFDGTVANRTSLLMEGTVTADGNAFRDVVRWAGQTTISSGGFGPFALKARASVVGDSVALTSVNLEFDGNSAEGVISLTRGERHLLQATLAADTIDFTPYVNTIRLLARGTRDWNRQPFDLRGLSLFDLDMRLSAAKASIGPTKIGRMAIGTNLRNETLTLNIGEAQIHGGILKGSLSVAPVNNDANVKAQLQFTDVDLASSATELFGIRNLSGRGNLNVALEATGGSPYGLAQSLSGTTTLIGQDGTINGFNVEQLLKRLERRPLSGAGNFRSGSTPFKTLNIAVRIQDGIATTTDSLIEGPTARLTLSGATSIPAREYDLKGTASLISSSDAPPAFQLPFIIQGPWDDPLILPDSGALIRHSPASAPLLDSLKDRKTLDAVKSVIDRFTNVRKAPASATVPNSQGASDTSKPADPIPEKAN